MKCEIEFLAVGSGPKPGDAIIVRYGEPANYRVMLIDGGTAETGDTIVTHLKTHFGKDATLEHAVLTHSDADHTSGLRTVLKEIPVANLWIHIPWLLAREAVHLFKDKRWTPDGLSSAIEKEYDIISEIVGLAFNARCKVDYPFAGRTIGPFHVLSPTKYAYQYLLPQFDKTPDPNQEAIEAALMWLGKQTVISRIVDSARAKVQSWTTEKWATERLRDGGQTGASNESSVILYGGFEDGRRVLLTGDAGVNGLTWAADYADSIGLPMQQFSFVQIPHHGSRRNVGPTILNRVLGPVQTEGSESRFAAFVSAPADDETHPRNIVLNAFIRRGGRIIATQGSNKIHYGGFPKRKGYGDVTPLPFSTTVEAYD
jgi:Metallo-beta-lactamase superfamily